MNIEQKLLNLLKEEQATFALDALKRPQDRDNFEYGYRVGVVAGYEEAINVLLKLTEEEKYGDDNL
jgi:hypothetical protein|tara:strand:- start:376 stop:573 length:198 start_codon:yes stop_codon:yes gene_type:complete